MNADNKIYLLSSDKTEITICKKDDMYNNLEKNVKKLCKKYDFVNKLVQHNVSNSNNSNKLSSKVEEYNAKIETLALNIKSLMNEIDTAIIENGEINNNVSNNFDLKYI